MATLMRRQALGYNHRVDLYKPTRTIQAGGKPEPAGYTKQFTDVACRVEIEQSPSSPSPMGRIEADIVLAIDKIHFAEDQVIDDGWLVHNKTLNLDGSQSTLYGRWWRVRSEPQRFINSTRRRGGKLIVLASQEGRVEQGLPL